VAQLVRQFAAASLKDDGNLRFETLSRIGRPDQFVLLEIWKDQKAAEAHAAAEPTKRFLDALKPLLAAPPDRRTHAALVAGAPEHKVTERTVFAVTHVDVIPPQKDTGVSATTALAQASLKEQGNLRFEVLQQSGRANHMTVIEAWRDRAAREAHVGGALAKSYRVTLQPALGALYDERLYRIAPEPQHR
jgi:quinol monooxygenase YgiN